MTATAPICDLLGDPIKDTHERRRRLNRRKLIARTAAELRARDADPLKVMGRLLLDAIDRGDKEDMFRFSNAMLPYFAPRLTAIAVTPTTGPVVIGWNDDNIQDAAHADPAALFAAVVSAADPSGG